MVKYQIQFKPVNPINNKPMTNESAFVGGFGDTTTVDYDSILMYVKTNFPTSGSTAGWVNPIELQNITHPVWCVYAVVDTVKQAMKIAKPLMRKYGTESIQIVQVVPASTEIVFEEE